LDSDGAATAASWFSVKLRWHMSLLLGRVRCNGLGLRFWLLPHPRPHTGQRVAIVGAWFRAAAERARRVRQVADEAVGHLQPRSQALDLCAWIGLAGQSFLAGI
jgi:hypothetical protein